MSRSHIFHNSSKRHKTPFIPKERFKKNMHLARVMNTKKIDALIENYPKQYPTPKYLKFVKALLETGWGVSVYEARVSKYVFVTKGDLIYKIRFSNHKPLYHKELENDCDFYVGISHTAVHTTEQILHILQTKSGTIAS